MRTTIAAGMVLAAVMAFAVASPQAELVRRDEAGAALFVLTAPVEPGAAAVEVAAGGLAWTESLRPQSAVRLLTDAPARNRPGRTEGPPSGAILFAYSMQHGGESFCPFGPPGSQRVQCFRDFDADGDFDGAYVSIPLGRDYVLRVGRLTRLTPVRQLAFEAVAADALPSLEAQLSFDGWRGDAARFTLKTAQERLGEYECAPDASGVCTMLGLSLRVERTQAGGASITVLAAEPERQLRLDFT
ncbi:MAG: hypothetical protein GC206_10210 [Alphaproteobacteria bacterium]|nr:hypothetical protein [Alphaproteobacteria bacterium]